MKITIDTDIKIKKKPIIITLVVLTAVVATIVWWDKTHMTEIEEGAYRKSMDLVWRKLNDRVGFIGGGLYTVDRSKDRWVNLGAYRVTGWLKTKDKETGKLRKSYWLTYLILRGKQEPSNPDNWERCTNIDMSDKKFKQER